MSNVKFFATVSFLSALFIAPIMTIFITLLVLVLLPIVDSIRTTLVLTAPPSTYQQVKDVFQEDLDDNVETTCELACELACTVEFPEQHTETVTLIDYSVLSYKELQAICKKQRKSTKDIKLNSKKAVLIEWLVSNS